jgi:tRNA(Ile)-lysidine synthase
LSAYPPAGDTVAKRARHSASTAFSATSLAESLARLPAMRRFLVAFSGGADSLALLHAMCALREQLAPAQLCAVHVHHGLHVEADTWLDGCARICAELGVPFEAVRVDAVAGPGQSPEAAARQARYQALAALPDTDEAVCTAHHRQDQAETLLLQLLRGAGPAGLAAMPMLAPLGRGWLVRPLLDASPRALRDYLVQHGLEWTEDSSNADRRFDRNYLRSEIFPLLERRWPGVQRALARGAAHQADSAALAADLAEADLCNARGRETGTLSVAALLRLSPPRGRNLLRFWLSERGLPAPGAAHVENILEELIAARDDAEPLVSWPGAEVRRYRDAVYASPPMPAHDATRVMAWDPQRVLELPLGRLEAGLEEGRGLDMERCRRARLEVRFRQGGERFRPAGRGHSTALKKLLQASAVPPWLRDRVPLIYVGDELAAVAGLWVAEGFAVETGRPGWVLKWTHLPETVS